MSVEFALQVKRRDCFTPVVAKILAVNRFRVFEIETCLDEFNLLVHYLVAVFVIVHQGKIRDSSGMLILGSWLLHR